MRNHTPHRLLTALGAITLLTLAPPASAQRYETPPAHCVPAPPPAPARCTPPVVTAKAPPRVATPRTAADLAPTPLGGYTLPRGGFAVKMELGYPNLDLEFLFALGDRVQLGVGYRGLYTMNHSPYASLKWSLNSRNRDSLGLALQLRAGYSFPGHYDGDDVSVGNMLAGEYKWFAELWFLGTARRGRQGLFWGVGARVSQQAWDTYEYDDYGEGDRASKVMGVLSLEIGYELRINRLASFFLALGVDVFATDEFIPALPRFRLGVAFGS